MKKDKPISKKVDELKEKMSWFQSDEFNLDEAPQRYRDIEKLAIEVEGILEGMRNEVEQIQQKFD